MVLLKFLHNLHAGLPKHLSHAVIFSAKLLNKDHYLTFKLPKFTA